VFGKGGAFPPYEGLVDKFLDAKDFAEAFSVWSENSTHTSFANETEPKTIVIRNYSVTVQESNAARSKRDNSIVNKYYAAGAEAVGGKHSILITNKGRVKKISLLGLYRNINGEHEISMDEGEKVISVITEYDSKDNLYIVSRNGRIGAFHPDSIASKNIDGPFAKRLEIDEGDEVFSAFCAGKTRQIFIVSKSGWARVIPTREVRVYPGSGRGSIIEIPDTLTASIHYATDVNGNCFKVKIATNKNNSVQKLFDLSEPYEELFRMIKVAKGESVIEVKIK
jgi:DNA gyrase/topoisomerase IV subunit A